MITNFDEAIAGAVPPIEFFKVGMTMEAAAVLHSTLYMNGMPGPASAPSPGVAGEALTAYSGQIPFSNPGAGKETRLLRMSLSSTVIGVGILADRLWHNSGLVVNQTTEQEVNSVAFPARDRFGGSNGVGVMVAIEVTTATTNSAANTTISMRYLNQDGVEKVATIPSFPATAVAGSFIPFVLAAGDTGVRQVLAITLGTSLVTGAISLVAYRQLTRLGCPATYSEQSLDYVTGGAVKLYDNTVPFLIWLPSATTAATLTGQIVFTQG